MVEFVLEDDIGDEEAQWLLDAEPRTSEPQKSEWQETSAEGSLRFGDPKNICFQIYSVIIDVRLKSLWVTFTGDLAKFQNDVR